MAAAQNVKLKDHLVLALDIGTRFIKVAEMRLSKGAIFLLNVAVSPTPPNVMDSNQILDPVGLGRAIKSMMASNKIRTRQVVLAISGQSSVVVRPIDLPKMSVKELSDTMRFEVERHIPFTADEVVMDYAPVIDPDDLPEEESNMKVLLAVAQEELIKAYLKVMSVAGLQPIAMDVEILSAMRALIDIHQHTGQLDNTLALVNIGAVSTDISIINQGNLIFTRSVPIAGDSLTEAISDQLGRSFEEAEELKKEYGRIFLEPEEAETASMEPAAPFATEGTETDGLFNAFGGGATLEPSAAPAAPTTAQPPIFSLEEDFTLPGTLNLDMPPGAIPVSASDVSSIFGDAPGGNAAPFELDDGVDDELPVFRLGMDADEEHAQNIPVFTLDDEAVDDELPVPTTQQPTAATPAAPIITPQITPASIGGPVFDLSSELEEQLPPPLARPATGVPDADEPGGLHAMTLGTPTPPPPPATHLIDMGGFNLNESAIAPMDQLQVPLTEASETGMIDDDALLHSNALDDALGYTPGDMPQSDVFQRRIFDSMMPVLVELVTEIRRSFEYYSSREPDTPIDRVIIYGGTSRLPHLTQFIQQEIGLEVKQADPLEALDLSGFRQPTEYLRDLAPALPVCIGLGLRDMLA